MNTSSLHNKSWKCHCRPSQDAKPSRTCLQETLPCTVLRCCDLELHWSWLNNMFSECNFRIGKTWSHQCQSFTVVSLRNSMAVDMLKKTLYDPFDGRKDLKDLVSRGWWNGKPGKCRRPFKWYGSCSVSHQLYIYIYDHTCFGMDDKNEIFGYAYLCTYHKNIAVIC